MHTPGKWTARDGVIYSETSGDRITRPLAVVVAPYLEEAMMEGPRTQEDFDNARLIAACPSMADYVIRKAKEGDKDAEIIANSFGWSAEGHMGQTE